MPPGCGLAATVSARPRVLSAAERVLGHPGAGLQVVVSPVNCKLLRARASPYQFVPVCPGTSRMRGSWLGLLKCLLNE